MESSQKRKLVFSIFMILAILLFQNCSSGLHLLSGAALTDSNNLFSNTPAPNLAFTKTPNLNSTLTVDSIAFSVTGTENSVPIIKCSLDSLVFAACASPVGLMVAAGPHNFRLQAYDKAGVVLRTIEYSWNVSVILTPVAGATKIGWVPCAIEGETCQFTGIRRVLYGVYPESENTISSLSGPVVCSTTTFGINPSTASWATKYCWYEGDVPTITSAVTITGPAIDITKIPGAFPGAALNRENDAGTAPSAQPVASDIGAFREPCNYSHMAFDDPLVFPRQPGKSHLHVFFGNTAVNAYSTVNSVATSGTSTCAGGSLNRSSYWVPAMIDTKDGTPIRPASILTYYKSGYNGILPNQMHTLPPGLRMITGSGSNSTPGGNPVRYSCLGTTAPWQASIPNCPAGDTLQMEVTFRQCWDGVNLDSPDHKSHMADPVRGACPATHPVAIPVVSYNIRYKIAEANSALRYRLSSDNYDPSLPAGYSGHGDYFYGWQPTTMETFIKYCLMTSMDCHAGLLGNGRTL